MITKLGASTLSNVGKFLNLTGRAAKGATTTLGFLGEHIAAPLLRTTANAVTKPFTAYGRALVNSPGRTLTGTAAVVGGGYLANDAFKRNYTHLTAPQKVTYPKLFGGIDYISPELKPN